MSIENLDIVDFISVDTSNRVVLTISDHLEWNDSAAHQFALQAKLNKYLAFVESGELYETYPNAGGKSVVFEVVFKFRPDAAGQQFLNKARELVRSAGFELEHRIFAESYGN